MNIRNRTLRNKINDTVGLFKLQVRVAKQSELTWIETEFPGKDGKIMKR